MFKPKTIAEFEILEFIKQNFNLESINIRSLSNQFPQGYVIEVEDKTGRKLYFYKKKISSVKEVRYTDNLSSYALCDLK